MSAVSNICLFRALVDDGNLGGLKSHPLKRNFPA
jgi:hypothetical protein